MTSPSLYYLLTLLILCLICDVDLLLLSRCETKDFQQQFQDSKCFIQLAIVYLQCLQMHLALQSKCPALAADSAPELDLLLCAFAASLVEWQAVVTQVQVHLASLTPAFQTALRLARLAVPSPASAR